jgi:hypothetical protein
VMALVIVSGMADSQARDSRRPRLQRQLDGVAMFPLHRQHATPHQTPRRGLELRQPPSVGEATPPNLY